MSLRRARAGAFVPIFLSLAGLAVGGPPEPARRLSTGITGKISASGRDNPEYLLSFLPVQGAMLRAATGRLERAALEAALAGTPVTAADVLRAGLLREENGICRLNYLLLTVEDQTRIYRVAQPFGASLARSFLARRSEFDRALASVQPPERRRELLFGLVTGMLLNWEGLKIATELGFRAAPRRFPNGDEYLVHSSEIGAHLDSTGMYWGSHSFPGTPMTFSTFGDAESLPRLRGIPDVFFGPAEEGLEASKNVPEVYEAVRGELIAYFTVAIDDAGAAMAAVADGARNEEEIARRTSLSPGRLEATLALLQAAGYLEKRDDGLHEGVPVLTERSAAMVENVLTLGRGILADWLKKNHGEIERQLGDLSPVRNGLPFDLVFSEIWHYVFGFASRALAKDGFTADPRAAGFRYPGYVPLVFARSLHGI